MGTQLTAPEYLAGWRERQTWTHLLNKKHQRRLKWCADQCVGDSFADVGCALGHSTDILKKFHPGPWTGVEFSDEAIVDARKLFPAIEFAYAPEVPLLPAAGKWDSVVCSEVIEHVHDPSALLNSLLSIANRRIIITTPSVEVNDPGHVRLYNDVSLSEQFQGLHYTAVNDKLFYKVVIEI